LCNRSQLRDSDCLEYHGVMSRSLLILRELENYFKYFHDVFLVQGVAALAGTPLAGLAVEFSGYKEVRRTPADAVPIAAILIVVVAVEII
jgi:hypothetical protein